MWLLASQKHSNQTIKQTPDHDGDGINSINEDLDGNHIFRDDDTDADNTPNYLDPCDLKFV